MGRGYTADDLAVLINTIRDHIPNAALRTTVIVGFPGETSNDFKKLLRFIEKYRFDHLGVFTYSDSYDLHSHLLPSPVSKKLAQQRKSRLMRHQQRISTRNNQKYLGRLLTVLVESSHDDNIYLARSIFQAPEVDGLVYLHAPEGAPTCHVGEFCRIRITDTLEYDLIGEVA
jgi:ribosomal protein S12 methylthiotransferase